MNILVNFYSYYYLIYILFTMVTNINKYRNLIIILTFILSIFGVYMIKESSKVWAQYLYNDSDYFLKKQMLYFILGCISFCIGMKTNILHIKKYGFILLILSYILLILVLIPGIGVSKNGSTSWLGVGSFTFQPSEFFKLGIIVFNSYYLSSNYNRSNKIVHLLPLLLINLVGIVLIILQPDFGSCMVILVAIFIQVLLSRLKGKWFILIIILGLLGILILIISKSYRLDRIYAFIDPFQDPLGSGFQIIQSLYAIGPGGLIGQGINNSIQIHYYLPEPQTDFIYAIIVEEFGLIGGLIIIFIYTLIIYSSFVLIKNEKELFKAFLMIGLLGIFMIQVIINLGVVIGLFPVTGITLPLISYGGSSLVVIMFSLGLIVNKKGGNDENINRV